MDLLISSILTPIISIYTYKESHPNWISATCDNFIKNTYMYALSILLILWTILSYFRYYGIVLYILKNIDYLFNRSMLFIIFIAILYFVLLASLIYIIKHIDPRKILLKHIVLFIFIILFALLLCPAYIFFQNLILISLIIAIIIGIITYFIIMRYPNLITKEHSQIIFIMFISLFVLNIIFAISIPFILIKNPMIVYFGFLFFAISYIILLSFRLMIHHQNIKEHSIICNDNTHYPDYINESIRLFITIVNLILQIIKLIFLGKNKKMFIKK